MCSCHEAVTFGWRFYGFVCPKTGSNVSLSPHGRTSWGWYTKNILGGNYLYTMRFLYASFVTVFALCVVFVPFSASALMVAGENGYTITSDSVITEDIYLGGNEVVMPGAVTEDIVAVGGSLLINGSVDGDVLLVGGDIDVLGPIGDDVRVVGGAVRVGDRVGGDLVVLGGNVHILSGASIEGDVLVAGGSIIIDGVAENTVRVAGGTITLQGTVNGDVIVDRVQKLRVMDNAVVEGDLVYTSHTAAEIDPGAIIDGDVRFTETREGMADDAGPVMFGVFFGTFGVVAITLLISILIAAVLLTIFFKRHSEKIVTYTITHFWKELLRGLIVAICAPIILGILALTGVGLYVAMILGLLYLLTLVFASVYTGIVVGGYCARLFKKDVQVTWKWALLGVIVLAIIKLIPFVGWLIACILFLATLGTVTRDMYERVWLSR